MARHNTSHIFFTKGEIMEGWIRLYRQIKNHWIWKDKEPFDKRSAWIDLLLMVNHSNKKITFEDDFITIERGQTLTSIKKLSERWMWSRHKVSDYVNRLEQDGMIVQIRDTRKILISIVNYDKYQTVEKKRTYLRTHLGTYLRTY